jgi:hypothetical protein
MEVGTEQYFHFIFNEQERRGEERRTIKTEKKRD